MNIWTKILLAASVLLVLAALWLPGDWWRWLGTAVVTTFVAAFIDSQHDKRKLP